MANIFGFTIPDSPAALLVTYGAGALIRVQSSPTEGGTYGEVDTLPIETGVDTYVVYDPDGISSTWYRIRYEAEAGSPAGSYADPFQPMQLESVYASLAQFEAFIRDADTSDRDIKLLALDASSRAIDRATGRTFSLAGSATARYFTPFYRDHRYVISIDDTFDAAPTLQYDSLNDGTWGEPITDFALHPLNAPGRGKPFTEIVLGRGVYAPLRSNSVEVTAEWGWSAVPLTITTACLLQASRFFKRRDAPFGVAGNAELGSQMRLLAKVDPDVELMVNTYRRWWAAA